MKRFHVHLHVENLTKNIAFYSAMFGQTPARTESDYAKWMLQDPPVNFAISTRGDRPGVDHLGIQVESSEDLQTLKAQATDADMALLDEGETSCCYARSEKYWLTDPQGIAWEQFHTLDNIPVFKQKDQASPATGACCAAKKDIKVASAGCCAPTSAQIANGAKACC
ncbi:ArsI/CadI family heavy metal resistance metalloenzyme [Curvibacter fontanus]|jgi:lactoylglutathione lyase